MKDRVNRRLLIFENTTVPHFPNTPEEEEGQIAYGRESKSDFVPMFKKRPDCTITFVMIKGRQTYSFEGGFFTQGEAFGALISQASTYNSYVSG